MTELYLEFLAQSAARDQAYSILAVFGIGLVISGIALDWLLSMVFTQKLAARFLRLYTGGVLILQLAGLVILPFLKLD